MDSQQNDDKIFMRAAITEAHHALERERCQSELS